ncbi:MAG TPA: hypothetical protein PKB02_04620, partial [Anaerohalosphaeraceae bacterium]|nr:hypothetical protein [Anaerohalosphaeraceae bacterium]
RVNHSVVSVNPKNVARLLGYKPMVIDSFTVDQGLGFLHYINVFAGQGPWLFKWLGPNVEVMTQEKFKEMYPNESR